MNYIEDRNMYELLAHNLYKYGFPMMHDGMNTKNVSMEELIVKIFKDMPNPRFILGAFIVLYKNNVNTQRLYNLALEQNVINDVGWILEESYNSFKRANIERPEIKELIQQLEPLKTQEEKLITIENNDTFLVYAKSRQTPTSKKWNVLNGFREESFDEELERKCLLPITKFLEDFKKINCDEQTFANNYLAFKKLYTKIIK